MLPDVRVYPSSQSSGQVPNRLNFCLRSGRIFRRTRLFGACLQREAPQGISDMLPSDAVRLLRNTGFASTCLRRRQTTDSRRAVPVARRATGTKAAGGRHRNGAGVNAGSRNSEPEARGRSVPDGGYLKSKTLCIPGCTDSPQPPSDNRAAENRCSKKNVILTNINAADKIFLRFVWFHTRQVRIRTARINAVYGGGVR